MRSFLVGILCIWVIFQVAGCAVAEFQLLKDSIYTQYDKAAPCLRWLNSKGRSGCSTGSSGVVGRLWPVLEERDKEFDLSSFTEYPFVVVLSGVLLTPEYVKRLERRSDVVGILVVDREVTDCVKHPSSPDDSVPNRDAYPPGDQEEKEVWNLNGTNFLHREFKVPMWHLSGKDADHVLDMAQANLWNGTKWGVQLSQCMHAYQNTSSCLRHNLCSPINGYSVWTSFLPFETMTKASTADLPAEKFILLVSSMDSAALFPNLAVGADSDMSGLIASLAALVTLRERLESEEASMRNYIPSAFKRSIVAGFFDGESWGYLGSSRFVEDWTNFKCREWSDSNHTRCLSPSYSSLDFRKLKLENVEALIELKQVGYKPLEHEKCNTKVENTLFAHGEAVPIQEMLIKAAANVQNFSVVPAKLPEIPPSSSRAFLEAARQHGQYDYLKSRTVVLTDHDKEYVNIHYHSRHDSFGQLDLSKVTNASTVLAHTLYSLALNVDVSEAKWIHVDYALVSALGRCLAFSTECQLINTYLPVMNNSSYKLPLNHYTGVAYGGMPSTTSQFVYAFLMDKLRVPSSDPITCKVDADCVGAADDGIIPSSRCVNEVCFSSYVQFHEAYSLGLEMDKNGNWREVDSNYPNWAESYRYESFVRSFWLPAQSYLEYVWLGFSLVQTCFIYTIIRFARKKYL